MGEWGRGRARSGRLYSVTGLYLEVEKGPKEGPGALPQAEMGGVPTALFSSNWGRIFTCLLSLLRVGSM